MGFKQPIFNGKDYDLAVCETCKVVIDVGSERKSHIPLNNHYKGRYSETGDCNTRKREGRTVSESIGAEVTPAKRVEIQEVYLVVCCLNLS